MFSKTLNKPIARTVSIILLLLMVAMIMAPVPAFAADGGTIMDRVKQATGGDNVSSLQQKAASVGESFVKFLRTTAIIVAVVMFVVVAYALLFSPNVRTIADAKGRIGALVLAIAMAVMAEQIVGTLLSWFGYSQ